MPTILWNTNTVFISTPISSAFILYLEFKKRNKFTENFISRRDLGRDRTSIEVHLVEPGMLEVGMRRTALDMLLADASNSTVALVAQSKLLQVSSSKLEQVKRNKLELRSDNSAVLRMIAVEPDMPRQQDVYPRRIFGV